MKKISLLGSTGSIGKQTLDLVRANPERYQIISLASAGNNLNLFNQQVQEFQPQYIYLRNQSENTLEFLVQDEEITDVVLATTGLDGLEAALNTLKLNKKLILANKETLIAAGDLFDEILDTGSGQLISADSEHVAIHQCLKNENIQNINKIYLTASGGPFHRKPEVNLTSVTVEQALNHPNWIMGSKITIDSATLMNKGLEVIEAYRLFKIDYSKIKVLVHPQSIIHSMVEFSDGNIMAQLGTADMRIPLQYALDYPERKINSLVQPLDFESNLSLDFQTPDLQRFPCLKLAYEAGRLGKSYPLALVLADEIAVNKFLNREIKFTEIPEIISDILEKHKAREIICIEDIREIQTSFN